MGALPALLLLGCVGGIAWLWVTGGNDPSTLPVGVGAGAGAGAKGGALAGGNGYDPSAYIEPIRDTTPPPDHDYYYDSSSD